MRRKLLVLSLAIPSLACAGNLATCILDKMPAVQNDVAASATYQVCLSKHPAGFFDIQKGEGRGLFGFDSGPACIAEKALGTSNNAAGRAIAMACNCLYEEPKEQDQPCARRPQPEINWEDYSLKPAPAAAPQTPTVVVPQPPSPPVVTRYRPRKQTRTTATDENVYPKYDPFNRNQGCTVKPVMTDEDYRACGSPPPGSR